MGQWIKKAGNGSNSNSDDIYYIELSKWGISNDFTNPDTTTAGINNAIQWAKSNGYRGVYLKSGTYCINTGYWANEAAQTGGASPPIYGKYDKVGIHGIVMVSDFTFEMHPNCILKANPDSAHFQTGLVCYRVNNVIIKGGQIIGDRDTHNYVGYPGYGDDNVSPAYGGHGYGLYLESVDGLKVYDTYISDWHGDGILINGTRDFHTSRNIYMKNVTSNNNRRQGMSSGGYNLLFEDCTFSNSNGQDPESGVDLEGGIGNENVIFRRCKFIGNNQEGLIAYDCDVRVEDSYFDQIMFISDGARNIEAYNTTFTDENYRKFFTKYPNLMLANQSYKIGERARLADPTRTWFGQAGYICTKAGTTSSDLRFTNKNNYPPNAGIGYGIQNSQRNVTIVCGDSEWLRVDYLYVAGGTGGLGGIAGHKFLPVAQRANNTPYNVGDRVHFVNSNAVSMQCIVSGTTGTAEPDTSSTRLGESLTDGTVTWQMIDAVEPVGLRQNYKAYNVGDYIWWDTRNSTVWECITAGSTGGTPPRLEDLPNGTQIKAHYGTSTMTKIAWDSSYPQWTAGTYLSATTNINIGNTSWSCSIGNLGDKEPDVTSVLVGSLVADGTVVWKRIYDHLNSVHVEECTFKNVNLVVGSHDVTAINNMMTNGQFTLTGNHVISKGNVIDNREKDVGISMSYTANSGEVRDDILRNCQVQLITPIDYRKPKKRIFERLSIDNGIVYGDPILYDSTIAINRDLNASTIYGNNQVRMVGGNFSAYVLPNVNIFGAWHSSYEFTGVTFDIILSDATGTFFKNNSRMSEGNYYVIFRDCAFRVLPQVYDAQLFNQAYNNANIKLLHNKFVNLDTTKSIKIWIPTQDSTNTSVINNYFDHNYYVLSNGSGTYSSSYNKGGYSLITTRESATIPTSGDYVTGTRITNSSPAIGSPKGWIVTTAGQAYGSTRANSTNYNVGDWIKWSTGNNIYECIQSGTTAATAPSAGAGQVVDGSVTWLYRGNITAVFTSEGNL